MTEIKISRSFDIFYTGVFRTTIMSNNCQTTMMGRFAKIVNNYKPLSIFAKSSILDVWQGSGYASVIQYLTIIAIINYLFHNKVCCHRKILRRKGSKCVTWIYCIQILYFPTGNVAFYK